MNWTDITQADPESGVFNIGSATFNGGTGVYYQTVWCPTARPAEDISGVKRSAIDKASRTSTDCYMRGVKEQILFETIGGASWSWRRICFTVKGDSVNLANTDPTTSEVARITSNGMMRLMTQDPTTFDAASDLVFEGTFNQDWFSPIIAKTTGRKVTIHYDKLRTINGGNAKATARRFNIWHPMNKNLFYEDFESGGAMNPSMFAVEGPKGMGDYYIYDIFEANTGAVADTDVMQFTPQATLYWHEK